VAKGRTYRWLITARTAAVYLILVFIVTQALGTLVTPFALRGRDLGPDPFMLALMPTEPTMLPMWCVIGVAEFIMLYIIAWQLTAVVTRLELQRITKTSVLHLGMLVVALTTAIGIWLFLFLIAEWFWSRW